MTPTASTSNARETFLAAVRAANLFAPMYLSKVEAAVPATVATPVDAARALIAAGHLTKFQAERLLAGKTDGFHLGPYVILEQVGRGSMGRVYKARHQTMNRPVAVKVIAAELTKSASERQAIQKEVRAAAQLNHENIVTAYDANEIGDRFYLVLEYVDGPNLDLLIKQRGALPIPEVCELLWQAAMGLDHAHTHGMIHRDIKPSNLLVTRPSKTTPDQLLKISDFGIAKFSPRPSLTQTPAPGASLGSADYTAPELTNHPQHADHRIDLYSLGAVAYFLLTGNPPFAGGNAEEKARRHLWEEPARLELVRRDIPPVLAILVHQMLSKNPLHRPGTAAEVVSRIEGLLASFGDAISFDLPANPSGSFTYSGHLSGIHHMPGSGVYSVPPSGTYTGPGSGVHMPPPGAVAPHSGVYGIPPGAYPPAGYPPPGAYPAPMPPPPAPAPATPAATLWSGMGAEDETTEEEAQPRRGGRRYRHRSQSGNPMVTAIVVLALAVGCFAAIGLALKFMIK
jgi:serine/threonine-protein kinase